MTYLVRMTGVLVTRGDFTVTDLALLSRMNHKRCNALLDWLLNSGYIQVYQRDKKRYITMTQTGRHYANRLLEVSELTRSASKEALDEQNLNKFH